MSGDSPSTLLARDRLGEFLLGHPGAALYAQVGGALIELLLGAARKVHPAEALAPVFTGPRVLGARIGGAFSVLRDPAIALLLELVLERRICRTVRPLALTVGLGRTVVGLGEGLLRLLRRALERVGEFRPHNLAALAHLGHDSLLPASKGSAIHTARSKRHRAA